MVRDRIKQMKNLIQVVQEIHLLSQGKRSNVAIEHGSFETNSLAKDNKLLQQNLYEYEKTLNDLDQIFRRDDSKDEIIFELKNMIDQQLKKIVKLQ